MSRILVTCRQTECAGRMLQQSCRDCVQRDLHQPTVILVESPYNTCNGEPASVFREEFGPSNKDVVRLAPLTFGRGLSSSLNDLFNVPELRTFINSVIHEEDDPDNKHGFDIMPTPSIDKWYLEKLDEAPGGKQSAKLALFYSHLEEKGFQHVIRSMNGFRISMTACMKSDIRTMEEWNRRVEIACRENGVDYAAFEGQYSNLLRCFGLRDETAPSREPHVLLGLDEDKFHNACHEIRWLLNAATAFKFPGAVLDIVGCVYSFLGAHVPSVRTEECPQGLSPDEQVRISTSHVHTLVGLLNGTIPFLQARPFLADVMIGDNEIDDICCFLLQLYVRHQTRYYYPEHNACYTPLTYIALVPPMKRPPSEDGKQNPPSEEDNYQYFSFAKKRMEQLQNMCNRGREHALCKIECVFDKDSRNYAAFDKVVRPCSQRG